jgi:two-component sensor histidine kinase/PAS domain-containing protein
LTPLDAAPPVAEIGRAAAGRPLRARLGPLALALAAILVPFAIVAAGAWVAWRAAWAEVDRELAVAADIAGDFAQGVIETHARLLAGLDEALDGASEAEIRASLPWLREQFGRAFADAPLVRDILILGGSGEILARAVARAGGDGAPFLAALGEGNARGLAVTAAAHDPAAAAPVFAVVRRRTTAHGAVVALLDANGLGERLGRTLLGTGYSGALVRRDGTVVARHPPLDQVPTSISPGRPLIAALAAGEERGVLPGITPRDRVPVRVSFRRQPGAPGLAVAVARPEASIVAQWRAGLAPLMLVALPATLALWALAWVVWRQQRALVRTLAGLEQRVAERTASLREEQERLRLAIDAGRFSTWEADLRAGTTTRAGRSLETLGLPSDTPPSAFAEWHERIHPADRDQVRGIWDDVVAGRQPGYRIEYRFRRPDGAWRWIESTAAVVRYDPATGAPLRLAGTNRDITDRREEEERRDLLTREVNHRARNTLAIVQAILRLTRAEDAAGYARLIEGRIAALARAQSLLAAERWTGAPLGTLLTEELAPFGGTGEGAATRFVLGGPPLRLRAEAVQPLGMVMHELATNAAKHGALSVPGGRVEVSWQADEAAGLLHIRWAETGGPAPRFPQTRGVGSRVIEATAAGQLGGSVQRRWPASGLVCDLALPLATMRAGPA